MQFDGVVLVSFGGPEGPDDVMPFLRNVVAGREVPDERLESVAEQYHLFGGVSPIQDLNRSLVAAISQALSDRGRPLPVYWGNRNWSPFLGETVARMSADGIREAAAVLTSAYSSYSGCRQYIEDIEAARSAAGDAAPRIVKLQPYYDRSGFLDPFAVGVAKAWSEAGHDAPLLMTAHSLPLAQAANCAYESQLREVAARVVAAAGRPAAEWQLVFQSRSGPPTQPWLGPDINEAVASLAPGTEAAIVVPIGFVSDHMEVVHDIDVVAARTASERGIRLVRVPTPGTDPRFPDMIAGLVCEAEELISAGGDLGPWCGTGCCEVPQLHQALPVS